MSTEATIVNEQVEDAITIKVEHGMGSLRRQICSSEQALKKEPHVYQLGSSLATIRRVSDYGPEEILVKPLNEVTATELLDNVAHWVSTGQKGNSQHCRPPKDVVNGLLHKGDWDLPKVCLVTGTPTIRPDGSLVAQPGYDPATQILFLPRSTEDWSRIPATPTLQDAKRGVEALLEIYQDFPFLEPCDKAAVLSGIITPIARPAITGSVPMVIINANVPGTGKTLVAQTCSLISEGTDLPVTCPGASAEEDEKRITSFIRQGCRMLLFDNISSVFGNTSIDAAITSQIWRTRLLGRNETFAAPMRMCIFGTGNNVVTKGDLARRVIWIRMECPDENPEERHEYRIRDLKKHILDNRVELVTHALNIVRAYIQAGRPEIPGYYPLGSFDSWSDIVRAPIMWASGLDPAQSRLEVKQTADNHIVLLRGIMRTWYAKWPERWMTLAEVRRAIDKHPWDQPCEPLLQQLEDALCELAPTNRKGEWDNQKVGSAFRRNAARTFDGLKLVRGSDQGGAARWKVEPASLSVQRNMPEYVEVGSEDLKRLTQDGFEIFNQN